MAEGVIKKIALGECVTECDSYTVYTDSFSINSGNKTLLTADNTVTHGEPKEYKEENTYFIKGEWKDEKGSIIKEAKIGDTVFFHIETQNINKEKSEKEKGDAKKEEEEIGITLYDWDGWANFDDAINIVYASGPKKGQIRNREKVGPGGKIVIPLTLTEGLLPFIEDDGGEEIELYFECTYKEEVVDLPKNTEEYLIVYEKEVKITVFVELPHSKEDGWGAKGLGGHSAMAIGNRYFDYGPKNIAGTYSEQEYDYDFNSDGDKDDDVYLDSPSFHFAPGKPWWGDHIARRKGIKPDEVTLDMVLEHIKLYWNNKRDPTTGNLIHEGTFIYGKVHTIEFYVKKSQAKKMQDWWEERYKHLKVYSVWPWNGEQCTTAVKIAINEGLGYSAISKDTQKPSGLLSELTYLVTSTSKQHKGEKTKITVIKEEAADWKPDD